MMMILVIVCYNFMFIIRLVTPILHDALKLFYGSRLNDLSPFLSKV